MEVDVPLAGLGGFGLEIGEEEAPEDDSAADEAEDDEAEAELYEVDNRLREAFPRAFSIFVDAVEGLHIELEFVWSPQ